METLRNRHGSRRHSAPRLGIGAFGILLVLNTQPAIAEEGIAESFVLTDSQMDKVTAGLEPLSLGAIIIGS